MVSLADSCASDLRSKEVASFVVPRTVASSEVIAGDNFLDDVLGERLSAFTLGRIQRFDLRLTSRATHLCELENARASFPSPVASALAYAVVVVACPATASIFRIFARSRSVRGSRAASGTSSIRAPNPQPPDVERVSPSLERRAAAPRPIRLQNEQPARGSNPPARALAPGEPSRESTQKRARGEIWESLAVTSTIGRRSHTRSLASLEKTASFSTMRTYLALERNSDGGVLDAAMSPGTLK